MKFTQEIFLTKKHVTKEQWQELINTIANYNRLLQKWKIIIIYEKSTIHYYIKTNNSLPSSINGLSSFILKDTEFKYQTNFIKRPFFTKIDNNVIDILNKFHTRKNETLKYIEISFRKLKVEKNITKIVITTQKNENLKFYKLLIANPANILSVNFEANYNIICKSAPKYLDISKCLHLLKSDKTNSILKVDTFPYLQGEYYLDQNSINFARHSIVFGSSGCGKSKFLSLLINNINKNFEHQSKYKIVVIDPHASLENDIGGIGKVIDFKSQEDSLNLFSNDCDDAIISVELLLDVFKGLIPNGYNSKLERVLRHSIYLLLIAENFNFNSLRNLLLDIEFRNNLVNSYNHKLPSSIIEFFLSEFNDIKTKSYTEAISPIIALIDEMEMIPVFNNELTNTNLKETIKDNFLTIFSLDRTKLGDQVTKTISGLVMQQLLTLVQNHAFDEQIIFIVDEVAVIENPILNRFLSEARKYNLALILAGQYFDGISKDLQKSIFANVINYYIFRVAKEDATLLVNHFNMKIPLKDTEEQKIKTITDLQDRECIIRINANGSLLPAIKCHTLDFESIPRIKVNKNKPDELKNNYEKKKTLNFNTFSNTNLKDILISNSTSRKVVEK